MRFRWLLSWLIAFPLLKLLTGVDIKGRIPKQGSCIIACNHLSFLDPPALGIAAAREVHFLAKVGLFKLSAFFKWLIRSYNAIPISDITGLRPAIKLLQKGQAVVIFPEGTRARKGQMLPFNAGVSFLAINYRIPVIPAYIRNSNKRFLWLMLRIYNLRIKFGKPVYSNGYRKCREDYERFADFLQKEVKALV